MNEAEAKLIEQARALLRQKDTENERLRAALKPLAEAAECFQWVADNGLDSEGVALWSEGSFTEGKKRITAGDALRARAILAFEQSARDK